MFNTVGKWYATVTVDAPVLITLCRAVKCKNLHCCALTYARPRECRVNSTESAHGGLVRGSDDRGVPRVTAECLQEPGLVLHQPAPHLRIRRQIGRQQLEGVVLVAQLGSQ